MYKACFSIRRRLQKQTNEQLHRRYCGFNSGVGSRVRRPRKVSASSDKCHPAAFETAQRPAPVAWIKTRAPPTVTRPRCSQFPPHFQPAIPLRQLRCYSFGPVCLHQKFRYCSKTGSILTDSDSSSIICPQHIFFK
jgi:hypothetical protein